MNNVKHIIKQRGFNSLSFSYNSLVLEKENLHSAIKLFFNKYLESNKKYFLILKISYVKGIIASLHNGLIINKTLHQEYFNYCLSSLSRKGNDYSK